ncbi:N-acetylmuramoyl-L-alanine amidase [Mucilaginibacter sp.]|uniref:N-acetylmuramoyl-L-alanine amidase n=1 Tax=Mucilaginibacter sp. TaxID=1882438 RepID=UPI003AFFCFC8
MKNNFNCLSCLTFITAATLFLAACASNPYAITNRSYKQQVKAYAKIIGQTPPATAGEIPDKKSWVGTTNFNLRKPNYVIIHHTAQNSAEQTLKTFTMPRTQVSAHYVIGKDGTVYHMLNDYLRAWQAGNAKWSGSTDINSNSIGIELDNNGFVPFTEPQINSLLLLLSTLKKAYNIPTANFIGHGDIAPGRKVDPSKYFPWKTLAEHGFGNWYDAVLDTVPRNFNAMQTMRVIGYDTRDSVAALLAFKRHFTPQDSTRMMTDSGRMILNNLVRKY